MLPREVANNYVSDEAQKGDYAAVQLACRKALRPEVPTKKDMVWVQCAVSEQNTFLSAGPALKKISAYLKYAMRELGDA